MKLLDDLLEVIPDGEVIDVRIGLRWTAVVVETDGDRRCGLSSTLSAKHHHTGKPDVLQAGKLQELSAMELAHFARSDRPTLASVGVATINALFLNLLGYKFYSINQIFSYKLHTPLRSDSHNISAVVYDAALHLRTIFHMDYVCKYGRMRK